jgi:hypothetical protein
MSITVFESAQHLYEKKEGSGSIPLTNESISGSPTLPSCLIKGLYHQIDLTFGEMNV